MVAGQIVKLLALVKSGRAELMPHQFTFIVFGRALIAGRISQVQCDIPLEGRPAVVAAPFAVADRVG